MEKRKIRLVSVKEFSSTSNYSEAHVYTLVRDRRLNGYKHGKSLLLDQQEALAYYNNLPADVKRRIGRRKKGE